MMMPFLYHSVAGDCAGGDVLNNRLIIPVNLVANSINTNRVYQYFKTSSITCRNHSSEEIIVKSVAIASRWGLVTS